MWVALSNLKALDFSRSTYTFLFPLYDLMVRENLSSNSDPCSKKPLTAFSTSSALMLGSKSAISTSIRGMRWRTVPLPRMTSLKAVSSRPLPSLGHFSSTSRTLKRPRQMPCVSTRISTPWASPACFLWGNARNDPGHPWLQSSRFAELAKSKAPLEYPPLWAETFSYCLRRSPTSRAESRSRVLIVPSPNRALISSYLWADWPENYPTPTPLTHSPPSHITPHTNFYLNYSSP